MVVFGTQLFVFTCGILVTSARLLPDYCGPPRCNTAQEIATLQIAEDRNFFYQCARNSDRIYAPLLRPCGAGTVFGYFQQRCVFEVEWIDLCRNGITTTTSTAPITTPTTSLPITTPVTTTTAQLTTTTTTLLPITTTTTEELTTPTTSLPVTTTATTTTELMTTTTTTTELTTTSTTSLPITTTTSEELTTTTTSLSLTTTTTEELTTPTTSLPVTTTATTTTELMTTTTTTEELTTTTTSLPVTTTDTTTTELTTTTTTTTELTTTSTTSLPITTTTSEELTTTTTSLPLTTTTTQELTTTTTPPITTVSPPLRICSQPLCNTALEIVIQHPSEIADAFYLCVETPEGPHESRMLFCDFGSYFSFEQQACVPPEQWTNACDRSWAPTCQAPMCTVPLQFIVLYPAADREHFFQCIMAGMEAELRTCEPGTWFGFRQQACVQPEQWIDDCGWQ